MLLFLWELDVWQVDLERMVQMFFDSLQQIIDCTLSRQNSRRIFDLYSTHMDENIRLQKQADLAHLAHQIKAYQQTYHNRPLQPPNAHTYLEFTKFISQLAPTLITHYNGLLNKQEAHTIANNILDLFDDLLAKIKHLVQRTANKENTASTSQRQKTEVCRVCLRELRTIQVATAKQELQQQKCLSTSIWKIIQEIEEESQPFTKDEDRYFFKQLQFALEKKQQTIDLCTSESQQFIKSIEEQLLKLVSLREQIFSLKGQKRQVDESNIGLQLKQNVSNSIKQHINHKLPSIIAIVAKSLSKAYQRQQNMKYIHAETQTIEFESSKVIELRRKLNQAQATASLAVKEREALHWTIHEKQMVVGKLQQEINLHRQQFNQKEFELHKQIRTLEQKCKKLKEQIQKQKLKSKRELYDREFTQTNIRTMKTLKTFHKLKQVQIVDEQHNTKIEQEGVNEQAEKKSRKKKGLYNPKGSTFFLPTLTKINREESQLISSRDGEADNNCGQQLNKTAKTDILKDKNEYLGSDNSKKKENFSKTTLQKRGKNEMKKLLAIVSNDQRKIAHSKSPKENKSKLRNVSNQSDQRQKIAKVEAKDKSKRSLSSRKKNQPSSRKQGQSKRLLATERSKVRLTGQRKQQQSLLVKEGIKTVELEQKTVNLSEDKVRQVKGQNSVASFKSVISIAQQIFRQQNQGTPRQERESILKSTSFKSKELKVKRKNEQKVQAQNIEEHHSFHVPQEQKVQNIKSPKEYFACQYEKINEQIQKESYITPLIGIQSPGLKSGSQLKAQLRNSIERNLDKVFEEMNQDSEEVLKLNYQKFSTIFANCLKNLKQSQFQHTDTIPLNFKPSAQSPKSEDNMLNSFSFHRNERSSVNFKEIPIKQMNINGLFEGLPSLAKQVYRPTRFSTEMGLLKHKIQRVTDRQSLSIHKQNYQQRLKVFKNIQSDSKRINKISRDNSIGLIVSSPKHLQKKMLTENNPGNQSFQLSFNLFIDQQKAYEYQSNLNKKQKMLPLSQETQTYVSQLFNNLEKLKFIDKQSYQQVCGYLRYPFTNSQQGFHLDIVNNIGLESLGHCFQRLMAYHRNCKTQKGICLHFSIFKKQINKLVQQSLPS